MNKITEKTNRMQVVELVGKDSVMMNMNINLEGMKKGWTFFSTNQNAKAIVKPLYPETVNNE